MPNQTSAIPVLIIPHFIPCADIVGMVAPINVLHEDGRLSFLLFQIFEPSVMISEKGKRISARRDTIAVLKSPRYKRGRDAG